MELQTMNKHAIATQTSGSSALDCSNNPSIYISKEYLLRSKIIHELPCLDSVACKHSSYQSPRSARSASTRTRTS